MNHHRVVNVRHTVHYDVYIGRGRDPRRTDKSNKPLGFDWGNPFVVGKRSRAECIKQHVRFVLERPWLVEKIRQELRRKVLGCWCDPQTCHGNIYGAIADSTPVPHEFEIHVDCTENNCQICDGGLAICKHCRGGEGSLTTECPRTSDMYDSDAIYRGEANYIFGQWVRGCIDKKGIPDMPNWCGPIYGATLDETNGWHPDD